MFDNNEMMWEEEIQLQNSVPSHFQEIEEVKLKFNLIEETEEEMVSEEIQN